MIVRSAGYYPRRGVFRAGPGVLRTRGFFGPRRFGVYGARRGPFYGARGVYGARLAPWVHRPYVGGYRPGFRGRLFGGVAPWGRSFYPRLAAPWLRGRYAAPYATGIPYLRRRPWIFRSRLPWLTGYDPAPVIDTAPVVPPPIFAPPPPPEPVVAAPPPDDAAAPPPGGPPPDASAGGPPGGGAPSADAAGAAPGGAPPEGGSPPPDGAAPPAGELPQSLSTEGKHVRIRWDHRVRGLTDAPPPGGGVYVIYCDGRPEAVHMTDDFRSDIAKRFSPDAEDEDEGHVAGQNEFWRGRRRFGGRFGRRRRYARFGRMGFGRFGRMGRIRMLRSLRQQLLSQQGGDQDPQDGDDDQQGGDQ